MKDEIMPLQTIKKSVALKISLSVSLLIAIITAISILLLTTKTQATLHQQATENLRGVTTSTVNLVETYYLELSDELDRLCSLFASQYSSHFSIDTTAMVQAGSASLPTLLDDDKVVNGDYTAVDRFAEATQGNATVFVRQGDNFFRITTSVKDEKGERAVGTSLQHESPAYSKILAGESYFGRVQLFGKDFMTKYQPIKDAQGQVIGILYVGIDFTQSLRALRDRVKQIKVGTTGYIYALDARAGKDYGNLIIHPTKEGQNILDSKDGSGHEFIKEMLEKKNGIIHYPWLNQEINETKPREKMAVFQYVPGFDWVISAGSYSEEFNVVSDTVRNTMLVVMIGTLLLSFVAIIILTHRIIGLPLKELVGHLQGVAEGNYNQTIGSTRADEIGILFRAVASMQQQVRQAIQRVILDANKVFSAADILVSASQKVSKGSQEQSDAASAVAAAIEEMTVSINQVADNANEARAISVASGEKGSIGSVVIQQTTQSIQDIAVTVKDASTKMASVNQQSSDISKVVQVIKEIADQINLLALNAAIEAARAGEQGRGFAVVADEVRKLAERTTQSTIEIVATINTMQASAQTAVESMDAGVTQVNQGVQLAMEAATSITDIKQGAERVVAAVNDISLAINEQGAASNLVADQVEKIAQMSEQNSAAIKQTSDLAKDLKELSVHLNQAISHFKV